MGWGLWWWVAWAWAGCDAPSPGPEVAAAAERVWQGFVEVEPEQLAEARAQLAARLVCLDAPLSPVEAAAVLSVIDGASVDWLERTTVVDRFDHEEGGQPVRTYTYELTYRQDQPRTVEEVNGATEALIAAVESGLQAEGVRLRA